MSLHLKSISTDSTIISKRTTFVYSSSTDIHHPLISDCPSTDMPNNSYPLKVTTTTSTPISQQLMVSAKITEIPIIPITVVV